ncbi:MAG: cell division protein FtsQ/DivIB [Gemmatimonadales bacterium]
MTVGRGTVVTGATMVFIAIVTGSTALARRLAFFRVRQVEVIGTRYLDPSDVVRRLELRRDASTYDPLGPARKAVAAIPGVVAANVQRRLPGTLRVTLREATPVALMATADRMVLVDSEGRVLPFDPVRAPVSLPIAGRDAVTARLLARLKRTDAGWYDTVESARLDRGDVVLDAGRHRVRLRPEANDAVLRGVGAVRRYLSARGIAWREIDARYHQRLFVRKGPT